MLVLTDEPSAMPPRCPCSSTIPGHLLRKKPLVARDGQANVREEDFFMARELLNKAQAAGAETAMVFNYRFSSTRCSARSRSSASAVLAG